MPSKQQTPHASINVGGLSVQIWKVTDGEFQVDIDCMRVSPIVGNPEREHDMKTLFRLIQTYADSMEELLPTNRDE